MSKANTLIKKFQKQGTSFLSSLSESELSSVLLQANKAYHNDESIMSDSEYDIVREYIETYYPLSAICDEIGAPIDPSVLSSKAKLPYVMPSMNKIKPDTNALEKWKNIYIGPYVLSYKLDGVSALYTTEGSQPKLYTRGDGLYGQDISHIIPYLLLPSEKDIVIRGELIISKKDFEMKYKSIFANPRNMIPGLLKNKQVNESIITDVKFVAYEVIKPILKPSFQMNYLNSANVKTVMYDVNVNNIKLTNKFLSLRLTDARVSYPYEIDGIIITNDQIYNRPEKCENPEHSFAFKMVLTDQIAEAKVVDVIWSASKDGYLKPRVQIAPINLKGVLIEYATGNNAKFIKDNKIGVGAIIELIRSNDVIPKIQKVIVSSSEPKMPDIPYIWNETGVDIQVENIDTNEDVKEKIITLFFNGIGVEGLSSGNVARIIDAGFDTLPKILQMSIDDLKSVNGFQTKKATKLHNGIKKKIEEASLLTLMTSSNAFGRGFSDKKLELILSVYPDIIQSTENPSVKKEMIASIKGMGEISSNAFVDNILTFIGFLQENGLMYKLSNEYMNEGTKPQNTILSDKTVVISGFRDKELEKYLTSIGVKIGSSISKNTFILVIKTHPEDGEETGKLKEAKRLGVPIMTLDEFNTKYLHLIN